MRGAHDGTRPTRASAGGRTNAPAAAAPTHRRARERPDDRVRAQQPGDPVERRLREPARFGRSMRRTRPLVVPHRRLPQLRDDAHRRQRRLRPRSSRTARRRQRAHLLLTAARRRGARSVTGSRPKGHARRDGTLTIRPWSIRWPMWVAPRVLRRSRPRGARIARACRVSAASHWGSSGARQQTQTPWGP